MGSASTKAGMGQSKVSQEKIDKVHSMVNPKREMGGGAFGKSRSRKRARGAQGMLDRQLATLDNMKSKMKGRSTEDLYAADMSKSDFEGVPRVTDNSKRFALKGMQGSALAKIVKANKAKAKRHLK